MDPPPIDVLPDDVLYLIVSGHVRDPKDLGACLVAWRRFHVLAPADLAARRCRYSTLLSLCAAGDIDGLHYAASRPDVFGPVAGFRWDACLYVAVVGDRVDILDHIKGRIVAVATPKKSTPPDGQEAGAYVLLDEPMPIRSVSQNPTTGGPTWPLMPAPWLALAVAAARCGIDGSLAWLCAQGNRPSRVISAEAAASALKTLRKAARQDAWLLWHRLRLDIGVVLKNAWAVQDMTTDAMHAIAERVSVASGLDVAGLFERSIALGADTDEGRAPRAVASVLSGTDQCGEQEASDNAVAHEAIADPSSASDDASKAIWRVVSHGGLPGLRAQHGDDAVAGALKRCANYPAMFAKFAFRWLDSMSSDSPSLDSLSLHLPWASARDDIVWLYRHGKSHETSHNATIFASIAPVLVIVMALAGRRDLMAELGDDPQSADRVVPAAEPALGTTLTGSLYVPVAATAFARDDMDIARWACMRMGSGDPCWAWKAWREGHADAVRFLYAHGCARAPFVTGKDAPLPSDEPSKSPLYVSLCARDAEAVALLLDPTAADDSCRGAVDEAISAAIAMATDEALAEGNLRVVLWLHRRYEDLVDAVLEKARATRAPSLVPVCIGSEKI
ncbi:hypothetical protein pdul_cds_1038 [Pandoravirus dulcis]|uniref:Ankyrin repeat domain containing protein n=1 Tax=Pandoravirus dulcis TaxID=1349409 RepID=S4VSN0_9VIRU|nr:hypothetical protein pdul_cds_1038 [Pandoravirus dulcis]AGO83312.1 hypothetical protein pdul_cds_1038 [Pandoravirus dulcis]